MLVSGACYRGAGVFLVAQEGQARQKFEHLPIVLASKNVHVDDPWFFLSQVSGNWPCM